MRTLIQQNFKPFSCLIKRFSIIWVKVEDIDFQLNSLGKGKYLIMNASLGRSQELIELDNELIQLLAPSIKVNGKSPGKISSLEIF